MTSIYWSHTMWLLHLAFFHLAYYFWDTCCCMYQYFILLWYQIMFHFMDILHLLMQSSVDVHFGYFSTFGYLNQSPMKIQVFYEYIFSLLFLRITGSHVNFKIFEELPISNMATIFYILMYSNAWELQIFYINANILLFDYSILLGIKWCLIVVWRIFS